MSAYICVYMTALDLFCWNGVLAFPPHTVILENRGNINLHGEIIDLYFYNGLCCHQKRTAICTYSDYPPQAGCSHLCSQAY